MDRVTLIGGIAALVLGVVILVFAEGLRRYYSGLFFVGVGLVAVYNSRRLRSADRSPPVAGEDAAGEP